MTTRRQFIQISSLASAALLLPRFLKAQSNISLLDGSIEGRKMIVVQLTGGNDGLNTVVPYCDDVYYRLRPKIGLKTDSLLTINDELAFNKALEGFKNIYDDGGMCILNNVGYPNPDRSHFRSMDIWQTASNSDEVLTNGWIGRYLDAKCPQCDKASMAIEVDDMLSLALKGEKVKGMAVKDPQRLFSSATEPYFKSMAKQRDGNNESLDYLVKTMTETMDNAQYIYQKSKIYKSTVEYPNTTIGKDMKTIGGLIISGIDTKVFYVSHGSFDTHVNEIDQQGRLLRELGDAVAALVKDLKMNNRFNDVMLMTFSEFGRRVAENASGGTDHGTANNVFIMGGALHQKGVYNPAPNLTLLQDGDLTHEIDFRQVYTTLLSNWMGVDGEKILGRRFEPLLFV
jgi:uncharacterized protein (DUF1501 family)